MRAGASKPAGYDNPLYTSGDILGDREPDAADVMPLVVGDHAVLTPRRPESPLVAKLKAQASEKGHKLRQDRILVRLLCACFCAHVYWTILMIRRVLSSLPLLVQLTVHTHDIPS